MGYLSSIVGKPVKWLGGAAALYGGYKLATENGDEVAGSLEGAAEGLSEGDSGLDAVYGFLDSTQEEMESNPEYSSNLGTAGKGLAAGLVGAYLDGSFDAGDLSGEYLEDSS